MTSDALRPAISAELLVDFAVDRGLDVASCLRGTGHVLDDLKKPGGHIPTWVELRILRNVVAGLPPDPTLGSQIGRRYHLSACGVAGLGLMSAPNMRVGLEFVTDYRSLFHSVCRVHSERAGIRLDARGVPADLRDLVIDRDMALMANAIEDAGAPPDAVARVELERTGNSSNRWFFDTGAIDQPLRQANETVFRACLRDCDRLLDHTRTARANVVDQVRGLLYARRDAVPSFSHVAAEMLMSTRTLRRRLNDAGTTYRSLVSEFRMSLAKELLVSEHMTIAEVGDLAGYSEPAAFVRAFKTSTGVTPHRYRMAHADQQP